MQKLTDLRNNFKNKTLFDQALTHRSWPNENKLVRESNERLEFLGDAILDFIAARDLYDRLPDKNEGYLTALRAKIVNTKNLYEIAKKLDLGKHIFISKGEEGQKGRSSEYILADTVEAIIGAIYLDQGPKKAKEFIKEHVLSNLDEKLNEPLKDAKSSLQEIASIKKLTRPKYEVIKETGPDNAKKFTIIVKIDEKNLGKGIGKTKQEAEQKAASVALTAIK